MKAHGWTYKERSPRHVAKYIYAQTWTKVQEAGAVHMPTFKA